MKNTKLFLESKTVKLDVYDVCKYTATKEDFEREKVAVYKHVAGFAVVSGEDAKELEAETDGSCIDDHHEYLVLYFEDGDTATFRNSYVDMFLH